MAKKKKPTMPIRMNIVFALALLVVTFGLFIQTTSHEFVNYDDDTLITSNRVVVDPNAPLSACFEWNVFSPHFKPLVLLSWRAEYQIFGADPAVFHFNNTMLHVLNVLLVFLLSLTLIPRFISDKKHHSFAAFAVALLFAVHPLHVESVAWAVERKDVLYTFFFLLSWWAYLQYLDKSNYLFLILSTAFFALTLLSKSMGITLPAVLFLTDYLYQRKNVLTLVKEKTPILLCFVGGIFLYGLGTYFSAFFSGGVVGGNTNVSESLQAASEASPLFQIILMVFLKVTLFLVHVLIPLHISVIYEGAEIQRMLGGFMYAIPFLLLGIIYLTYRYADRFKELFFGLAFFLLTISPAIMIGKYGGVGIFAGDRYTYTPMLGLLLAIVVLVYRLPSISTTIKNSLLGALATIYFILAYQATGLWKNAETLWTNAIHKTVCAAPAYNGRGVYYLDVLNEKDKALADFNQAIQCDSTHAGALYNRGLILMGKNRNQEALDDYSRAIRIRPDYLEAFVNRGNIYRDTKENEAAMQDYNTSLRINPNFSKSYFNRGGLFLNLKQFDDAINDFTIAISLEPEYAKAYYNRGLAYFNLSNKDAACQDFANAAQRGYAGSAETIKAYCK